MAELGGVLGRAKFMRTHPKYESPSARLTRLKAAAREEAFVRRHGVPLDGASFTNFLRTGRSR